MKWLDTHQIQVDPPKRPLKLTGTRFGAVLGLNRWKTPFATWCEITRTYKEPFIETIYTAAGKTIEPKQADFMRKNYFMTDLVTPTDVYGENYFDRTHGDFFADRSKVFGGAWDYLRVKDGTVRAVLEMKTSKRVEDWQDDIPEYYALQAALYAHLLGVDDVVMVASFLSEQDYEDPSKYKCTAKNTIVRPFKLSERYPNFEADYIYPALDWWEAYVETGISPQYDEKKDAEILAHLRTNNLSPDTDVDALINEAETLKAKLDAHAAEVADDEKRYKVLTDMIKAAAIEQFREGDKKVTLTGTSYTWEVSRSSKTTINKDALKKDGLLDQYSTTEESYRLVQKAIKEEK